MTYNIENLKFSDFPERIALAMSHHCVYNSISELSRVTKISRQLLYKYCNGEVKEMSAKNAYLIANALNVSLDWLISGVKKLS